MYWEIKKEKEKKAKHKASKWGINLLSI